MFTKKEQTHFNLRTLTPWCLLTYVLSHQLPNKLNIHLILLQHCNATSLNQCLSLNTTINAVLWNTSTAPNDVYIIHIIRLITTNYIQFAANVLRFLTFHFPHYHMTHCITSSVILYRTEDPICFQNIITISTIRIYYLMTVNECSATSAFWFYGHLFC